MEFSARANVSEEKNADGGAIRNRAKPVGAAIGQLRSARSGVDALNARRNFAASRWYRSIASIGAWRIGWMTSSTSIDDVIDDDGAEKKSLREKNCVLILRAFDLASCLQNAALDEASEWRGERGRRSRERSVVE